MLRNMRKCPLALREFDLHFNAILPSLGSAADFARAFRLPPQAAPVTQSALSVYLARSLAQHGYTSKHARRLFRKGKRVDRLTRFSRAALVSLATTMPVAAAATAGGLIGAVVGASGAGIGAAVGAPVGALAGALLAAPLAAPLSTALYELDHEHRHHAAGREFTARTGLSCRAIRASNLTAYGLSSAAASSPQLAAQGLVTSLTSFAGVAASCTWGGAALIAAPLVSVAGTAMRVGMQEAFGKRVAGTMFGLHAAARPGADMSFDEGQMLRTLDRLDRNSTARLVARDLRDFLTLLRRRLPDALRSATTSGKGLGQTLLNGLLMAGSAGLGAATQGASATAGLPGGWPSVAGRIPPASAGAAAWGAGRPIHGVQRHHHHALQAQGRLPRAMVRRARGPAL